MNAHKEITPVAWRWRWIGYGDWIVQSGEPDAHEGKEIEPLFNVNGMRIVAQTALSIVEGEIKSVEAKPESDFGWDFYGNPEVPGGTYSWSKKDEELHYLNRDADVLRTFVSSLPAPAANMARAG